MVINTLHHGGMMTQHAMTERLQHTLVSLLDERKTCRYTMPSAMRVDLLILAHHRLVGLNDGFAWLTAEGRDVAECYAGSRRVA